MVLQHGETGALSLHRRAVGATAVTRRIGAAAGVALLIAAAARRGRSRWALGLTGATLLTRGVRSRGPRDERLASVPRGLAVTRAATIAALEDAIREAAREASQWLIGPLLRDVERIGPDRWRVVLRLPVGPELPLELETRVEDDGSFSFASPRGSALEVQGRVFFGQARGGRGTEVRATANVRPPTAAGLLAVRSLRGIADRALGHALARLRQRVETGEFPTTEGQPAGPRSLAGRVAQRVAHPGGAEAA
jgi:uncharacterized membrane protein